MTHWSAGLVGQPWVAGISDCWSFARSVWRERWGWDVPPIGVDPADLRAATRALSDPDHRTGWAEVQAPAEGDAVLMGRSLRPCHVGIWIDLPEGGAILHAMERVGVIVTPPGRLAALSLRHLQTYRRQS